MNRAQGFWSYEHDDDQADNGRIRRLRDDVAAQYEMCTGETLDQFLDQASIKWGDDWRKQVDERLDAAVFFIPVITPRYLKSPECRREFRSFAERSQTLGVSELILALHYVDVPALHSDSPDDELVQLLQQFQWMDWRELRFKEVETEDYRRAVNAVVERLVTANQKVEADTRPAAPRKETAPITGEEPPGLIDRLANAEEIMPQWNDTTVAIGEDIGYVGSAMQEAKAKIEKRPASRGEFAYRRAVTQQLARQLMAPTERIFARGQDFVSQVHKVDEGIHTIVELGVQDVAQGGGEERTALCNFFASVRGLASSAKESLEAVVGMVASLNNMQSLSRDLRPVLRRLSGGLTVMVEAKEVTDGWVRLIDGAGIECPDAVLSKETGPK